MLHKRDRIKCYYVDERLKRKKTINIKINNTDLKLAVMCQKSEEIKIIYT